MKMIEERVVGFGLMRNFVEKRPCKKFLKVVWNGAEKVLTNMGWSQGNGVRIVIG